jgi:hypothetical protein
MGCHTWFKVPLVSDKELIIKKAQEYLNSTESIWMTPSTRQMYESAVTNELCTPCTDLAYPGSFAIDWIIYIDIQDWSLLEWNKNHSTSYESPFDKLPNGEALSYHLECYSDEPRIGGYPDNIISSYKEMLEFMETGWTDEKGKHYDFYYAEERYDQFMAGIKTFFEKHPLGIITFG